MKTDKYNPERSLMHILPKNSGRNNTGKVTVRHQGGRQKRYLREIDFYRDKNNVPGEVITVEYDPNRTAYIALIQYSDGEKRYILLPEGLKVGDKILSGDNIEVKTGNSLPLKNIPIGTLVHNIEIMPGRGAKLIRSAGSSAQILSKEGDYVQLRFPSGEIRMIFSSCRATIGQVSNIDWKNRVFGKAGTKIHMGIRPTVRGVAQNPHSHPHGGGEGRSGIGMKSPKSPWGKRTLGKKTRRKMKYSNKYIIKQG